MLSHTYNIAIYCGVGSPGHVKYVVYGLKATNKRFVLVLIKTLQLPGTATNDSHMGMHTSMSTTDISLPRSFQKTLRPNMCTWLD